MTQTEFNKKWKSRIENRFSGMELINFEVINHVDARFDELVKEYPNLEFAQIKVKWGKARVYSNLPHDVNAELEREIDNIHEEMEL